MRTVLSDSTSTLRPLPAIHHSPPTGLVHTHAPTYPVHADLRRIPTLNTPACLPVIVQRVMRVVTSFRSAQLRVVSYSRTRRSCGTQNIKQTSTCWCLFRGTIRSAQLPVTSYKRSAVLQRTKGAGRGTYQTRHVKIVCLRKHRRKAVPHLVGCNEEVSRCRVLPNVGPAVHVVPHLQEGGATEQDMGAGVMPTVKFTYKLLLPCSPGCPCIRIAQQRQPSLTN
jgi:hypothetical protein